MNDIILKDVKKYDIFIFKNKLQESFVFVAKKYFGENITDKIQEEKDTDEYLNMNSVYSYHLVLNNEKSGGAVLEINNKTNNNELYFFFIYMEHQNKKIVYLSWIAVKNKYANIKTWTCYRPYFEKRNINFYVNRCYFHIVDFHNEYNKLKGIGICPEEFLKFEKVENK